MIQLNDKYHGEGISRYISIEMVSIVVLFIYMVVASRVSVCVISMCPFLTYEYKTIADLSLKYGEIYGRSMK